MICAKCEKKIPAESASCPECGQCPKPNMSVSPELMQAHDNPPRPPQHAAVNVWSKFKVPLIAGGIGFIALIVLLVFFIGGRGVVGTWEAVEVRYYVNGVLEQSEEAINGEVMELQRGGRLILVDEHGLHIEYGEWEVLSGRRLMLYDGLWAPVIYDYSIRGRELHLVTETDLDDENALKFVMILRRTR